MKTDISSLELHYLLKELALDGAKLEQLYQVGNEEFIFQFHVTGVGKKILRVVLGKLMYIANNKSDVPEKPPGFCVYLRKKLKSARLQSISQLGSERIVEFLFETKDSKFKLIIELFSKGNCILCDEQGIILSAMEKQEWKDRSIKPKEKYLYPKREWNFLALSRQDMDSVFNTSNKENLVKALAIDLGLGGIYAEELCIIASVDKNLKPKELSDKEKDSLHDALKKLLSMPLSATMVYADGEKTTLKDVVPFKLRFYGSVPSSDAESFNSALDSVLTKKVDSKAIETAEKTAKTKLDKVNEMISQQTQRIAGLEASEKENQRKGELIYENYILVQQVLSEINELRKKLSWQEIKEMFRNHKVILDITEKTGEVTIEI